MGRMISSIVKAREHRLASRKEDTWQVSSPTSATTVSWPSTDQFAFSHVPSELADKLMTAYLRHIAVKWPVLQTPFVRLLHAERLTLSDVFFTSVLHLIYAIGGQFLETAGQMDGVFPEHHHRRALEDMDRILCLNDIRAVQFLLLLSIYSLGSSGNASAWTYTGLAMRHCVVLGMHRRSQKTRSILDHENRKKVFWTCYCLDRQVSISLGRPFAISDRDIDAELPWDVDEACEDIDTLGRAREMAHRNATDRGSTTTSMTGFIHICRLRILESSIQQSIYRVEQPISVTEVEAGRFSQNLEEWRANLPAEKPATMDTMMADADNNYMLSYYKCLRFLFHPLIVSSDLSDSKVLRKCAEACGGICQTYKRLHQVIPVSFSIGALHSIFLAGFTLIYCAWASPKEVLNINVSNDLNACSIVLYIIAERWPTPVAREYRDAYETVKQTVLDAIEAGHYAPRRPVVAGLPSGLQAALRDMANDEAAGLGPLSALVTDMVGGVTPGASALVSLDGLPRDSREMQEYEAGGNAAGRDIQTPSSEWLAG